PTGESANAVDAVGVEQFLLAFGDVYLQVYRAQQHLIGGRFVDPALHSDSRPDPGDMSAGRAEHLLAPIQRIGYFNPGIVDGCLTMIAVVGRVHGHVVHLLGREAGERIEDRHAASHALAVRHQKALRIQDRLPPLVSQVQLLRAERAVAQRAGDIRALPDARHQVGSADKVDIYDGNQAADAGALGLITDEVIGSQGRQAVGERCLRRGGTGRDRILTAREQVLQSVRARGRFGDDLDLDKFRLAVDHAGDVLQRQTFVLVLRVAEGLVGGTLADFQAELVAVADRLDFDFDAVAARPGFRSPDRQRPGGDLGRRGGKGLFCAAVGGEGEGFQVFGPRHADDIGATAAV